MTARDIVMSAAGATPSKTYVEDVFSTYLYTGNGSTQTINNGIDLAGKGGMVWLKGRANAGAHVVYDTVRGMSSGNSNYLSTDQTSAQSNYGDTVATSSGFSLGANYPSNINVNGYTTASWTFRKAPKFFDVVTYTGDGVAGRQISHSLGTTPGMVIVKRTSATSTWWVHHRSVTNPFFNGLELNTSGAAGSAYQSPISASSSSTITLNSSEDVNGTGQTYVAYLFAHDTTTDGLIQCGSVTLDGTATYQDVNLGWEAQYVLTKRTDSTSNWFINDNMRGMPVDTNSNLLMANTSGAEASSNVARPTATGFRINNQLGGTYIYMAIRRGPMRTPTDGTKVFNLISRVGTGANATVTGVGLAPDLCISKCRTGYSTLGSNWQDKLRGAGKFLRSAGTQTEISVTDSITAFGMDGVTLGSDATSGEWNYSSSATYINWFFKRAPGFFDVVCYTGTGVARTVNHNLGVAPELMIFKSRTDVAYGWITWHSGIPITSYIRLNNNEVPGDLSAFPTWWLNSTYPTKSAIALGESSTPNDSGKNYVAYLFASCPGVSKVGSYTGNGTSQTINCGFSAGARFVLIKRTDSTGDWYVWDTARGIVASNDPHLSLNTTAAEVTTDDTIDPASTGFIVNQVAGVTDVNVSGGSYIYLAIA